MRCRFFRRVNKRRRRRGWRPPSGHPPLDPRGGWGGGGGAGEGAEPGEGGGGGEDRGGGWHPGCHADVTQSSEFFDTFWWEYQSILMKKKWSQWLCFCSPCWCLSWWQLKPRACGNPSWPMLPPGLNLQVRLLRFIHTHHYRDVKEEEKRKTHITAWLLMTLYAFSSDIIELLASSRLWDFLAGRLLLSRRDGHPEGAQATAAGFTLFRRSMTWALSTPKKHDFSDDPAAVTKLLASPPVWS